MKVRQVRRIRNRDARCKPTLPNVVLVAGCGLLLSLVSVPVSTEAHATEWKLEKSEAGVSVYTRPVEGSNIREFKGEGMIGVSIDEIVALLRTPARFKEWFPDTSESKALPDRGDFHYQYSVMAIPWPISDRDNVLATRLERDPETGRVDITIVADPDAYPVQDSRVRVRKARGSWLLEPRGARETFVRFQMHLEPGGGLPDWMVNARTVGTPFDALINLRKILGAGTPTPSAH